MIFSGHHWIRARHFLMLVCGGEKPVLLLSPTQHKSQSFACWNLAIAPNCGAKLPGPGFRGSFVASAGAGVEWGIPGLPTFELFASEASYPTPGSNQHVNQHMGIAHGQQTWDHPCSDLMLEVIQRCSASLEVYIDSGKPYVLLAVRSNKKTPRQI